MSKVQIVLNHYAIGNLLRSEEVANEVQSVGEEIKARMSGSYTVDTVKGKNRAITRVKTADAKTYYKNLKTNEMLKAVHK